MVGKGQKLLQGRSALITGASSGIGRAIAAAFAVTYISFDFESY